LKSRDIALSGGKVAQLQNGNGVVIDWRQRSSWLVRPPISYSAAIGAAADVPAGSVI
jgi:hypothetical protein